MSTDPHLGSGTKESEWNEIQGMSALPPKADIDPQSVNVRFVPKADIAAPPTNVRFSTVNAVS